jgi:hypothetical protein
VNERVKWYKVALWGALSWTYRSLIPQAIVSLSAQLCLALCMCMYYFALCIFALVSLCCLVSVTVSAKTFVHLLGTHWDSFVISHSCCLSRQPVFEMSSVFRLWSQCIILKPTTRFFKRSPNLVPHFY